MGQNPTSKFSSAALTTGDEANFEVDGINNLPAYLKRFLAE